MAKRDYANKGVSVTEVTGSLFKPDLVGWYLAKGLRWCLAYSARRRKSGSKVHDAIEAHLRNQKYAKRLTKTEKAVLKSFIALIKDKSIEPGTITVDGKFEKAIEVSLYSKELDYYGTPDLIDSNSVLWDWKTEARKTGQLKSQQYRKWFYQASGYSYALYEQYGIKVDRAVFARQKDSDEEMELAYFDGLTTKGWNIWKKLREIYKDYYGK